MSHGKRRPAAPPRAVWVSYCSKCGAAICADAEDQVDTSCPDCPIEKDLGPCIDFARYRLASACAIDDEPCKEHGDVVHGREAEELRSGIERLIEGPRAPCREYRETDLGRRLIALLDQVDARDSLAFIERRPQRAKRRR